MILPERLTVGELAEVYSPADAVDVVDASQVVTLDVAGAQLIAHWMLRGAKVIEPSEAVLQVMGHLGLAHLLDEGSSA